MTTKYDANGNIIDDNNGTTITDGGLIKQPPAQGTTGNTSANGNPTKQPPVQGTTGNTPNPGAGVSPVVLPNTTPVNNAGPTNGYTSPPTTLPNANTAAAPTGLIAQTAGLTGGNVNATLGGASTYQATSAGAAGNVTAGNATAGSAIGTQRTIDPATGTVQGQIASILDRDSPLMQRAVANANSASNARGLANSSLAVGAAQTALVDAAMPIAQADAGAYNTAASQNQAATNQASQTNAQLYTSVSQSNVQAALQAGIVNQQQANDIAKFNAGAANQAGQFNAASSQDMAKENIRNLLQAGIINQDQANKMSMFNAGQTNQLAGLSAQLSSDTNKFNASQSNDLLKLGVDADTKKQLASIEAQYKTTMQTSASAADLYKNTMQNIAGIMSNKDMTNDAKKQAVDNLMQGLNNGLSIVGKIGNMNLGSILQFGSSTPVDTSGNPSTNPAGGATNLRGPWGAIPTNGGFGGGAAINTAP